MTFHTPEVQCAVTGTSTMLGPMNKKRHFGFTQHTVDIMDTISANLNSHHLDFPDTPVTEIGTNGGNGHMMKLGLRSVQDQ